MQRWDSNPQTLEHESPPINIIPGRPPSFLFFNIVRTMIVSLFYLVSGTRDERLRKTLVHMGPAVLNGGFSTFLSIVLLCNSNSHVFITFFKVSSN